MRTRFHREQDEWSKDGVKINSIETLQVIREKLKKGSIIVERWIYCGASAPERVIIDDYEEFENYLNSESYAGDSFYIWSFSDVCRTENVIASGKCPNEKDEVPKKGAY